MFEKIPKNLDRSTINPELEIDRKEELETEEFISVMPTKFRKEKKKRPVVSEAIIEKPIKKPKGKIFLILSLVILILLIIGGGISFYFWAKNYLETRKPITVPTVRPPTIEKESKELKLLAEILDPQTNESLSTAELFFPAGALVQEKVYEFKGLFNPIEVPTSTYQYLAGVYKIGPEIPIIKKPINLKITYNPKIVDSSWENEIKFGYLKNDNWITLTGQLDLNTHTYFISFEAFPSETFALLIEKEKIKPKTEEIQIGPEIVSSSDQDNDGLTDKEEEIYHTNINDPDTDKDNKADGFEIANLLDPTHPEGTLILSGLVKVYTNSKYLYSFYYPSNWLIKPIPETDLTQILVITETGEFFEVSVENNPDKLPLKDWYFKQVGESVYLREVEINNQKAIWAPDYLHLYIGKDDKIYILTYNLGTEEQAHFKTTFRMIISSFQFITEEKIEEEVPEGKYRGNRPNGTLIKYATSTTVYLIENGKKRPIKSPSVFRRLGFTEWEKIIVIPDEEWYPTGEMLE
jgi:hypothetical protein